MILFKILIQVILCDCVLIITGTGIGNQLRNFELIINSQLCDFVLII